MGLRMVWRFRRPDGLRDMGGIVTTPAWAPTRSCTYCEVRIPAEHHSCQRHWDLFPPDIKLGIAETRRLLPNDSRRLLAEKIARDYLTWGRPTP